MQNILLFLGYVSCSGLNPMLQSLADDVTYSMPKYDINGTLIEYDCEQKQMFAAALPNSYPGL